MPATPKAEWIRILSLDVDAATSTRSVTDILEMDAPSTPTPRTWTELTRDHDRRALLLALVEQLDQLAAGRIDELCLTAVR